MQEERTGDEQSRKLMPDPTNKILLWWLIRRRSTAAAAATAKKNKDDNNMTAGDKVNNLQTAKNEGVYVTTATKDQFYYYREFEVLGF